jgi:hypothetical protein
MTRLRNPALTLLCAVLTCGVALVAPARGAGDPKLDANTACATTFAATRVKGDPNAAVVRVMDLAAPMAGTITAYGRDRMWTGTIGRSVVTQRYGVYETSLLVRADAPIEGIAYAPSWTSCTFHAGVRPRNGYDGRDEVDRPVLTVTNPQPVEPATCAKPYAEPEVVHAVEPTSPGPGIVGQVRVGVALDEHGLPQYARIISSAHAQLNVPSLESARRSEFKGAVFRCKAVKSGYEFTVDFA